MLPTDLQPDQQPHRWDDHVSVYETVFEPFTLQFARPAIAALGLASGQSVLDVAAGSGGAGLAMAAQGLQVTAIDASARMVDRMLARSIASNFLAFSVTNDLKTEAEVRAELEKL